MVDFLEIVQTIAHGISVFFLINLVVYQNLFLFLPTFELITYQLNILFYAKIFYDALYFGNAFRHDDGSGKCSRRRYRR